VHYKFNPVKTIKTNVIGTMNMLGKGQGSWEGRGRGGFNCAVCALRYTLLSALCTPLHAFSFDVYSSSL
jgi:hypothetical protein